MEKIERIIEILKGLGFNDPNPKELASVVSYQLGEKITALEIEAILKIMESMESPKAPVLKVEKNPTSSEFDWLDISHLKRDLCRVESNWVSNWYIVKVDVYESLTFHFFAFEGLCLDDAKEKAKKEEDNYQTIGSYQKWDYDNKISFLKVKRNNK